MTVTTHISYEFGGFKLDPLERLLLRDGRSLPLTSKAFDTLLLLIQRQGHLVKKSEIMDRIWADSFVEEHNLVVTISMLRKALADGEGTQNCIETVAKQGYRFVGMVSEVPTGDVPKDAAPISGSETSQSVISSHQRHAFSAYLTAGLMLAGLILSIFVLRPGRHVEATGRIHSLAVVPFRMANADADHAYLAFGLADAIIAKLAGRGEMVVRPTSAVLKYADTTEPWLDVGREQKVDAVLSGSVEILTKKLRVTIRLTRTSDGVTLLTEAIEEPTDQIFQVENSVAEKVSHSLSANVPASEEKISVQQDTKNSEARELYSKGRYFWNTRTEEGLRKSIEYLQQATVQDPQYARAYAGLADSYVLLASYGVESPQKAYPPARSAALNALRLDDSMAEAHASLGMINFIYGWNWEGAEQEFKQALALNPNYLIAERWYAMNLAATGRIDEALNLAERAKEIDPVSPGTNVVLGRVFYSGRQYEKAIGAFRDVIELNPSYARAHVRLGMAYTVRRNFAAAIHEFETARKISGPDAYVDGLLGCAQALSGNIAGANEMLQELASRSHDEYVPAFSIAIVYVGLGNRDRALDWLEKAYQDRSVYMVYLKTDPILDSLRSDPRFISLLHRMALL
jgi:DNA-binding winged helix-turn-helix (wHTH) protein/TolB-like protein/lipoprotein NlpI